VPADEFHHTAAPPDPPPDTTSEEIEADIQASRERLASSVDALTYKLDVKAQARRPGIPQNASVPALSMPTRRPTSGRAQPRPRCWAR
jgi:Protein of unknown function (DUF3618)